MYFVADPNVMVAPPTPLEIAYLTERGPNISSATHNFNSVSIGNEPNQIIACVVGWTYVGALDMTSLTIGGVATEIELQGDGTNCGLALAWAKTGSGSAVTIQALFPAAVNNVVLAVYRITKQTQDAPVIAEINAGGGQAARGVTIDAPANCALIAGAVNITLGSDGTFTGVDEDLDLSRTWAGSRVTTDAEPALTISHSSCRQILAAGWG